MKGRVIVLDTWGERQAAALVVDGVLQDLAIDPADDAPLPGAIYRGTVDRPVKGQGGVFLRLPGGQPGFLRQVSARSAEQVADAAEAMFHAHASCRRAQREGQAERHGYDLEVARERHRALNWSIGYGGASWDEVTTDT